jgi:hypothetical protein
MEQTTALNRIQRIPMAPNCTTLTSKSRIHAGQGAAVDIVHTEALHEQRPTSLNYAEPQVTGVFRGDHFPACSPEHYSMAEAFQRPGLLTPSRPLHSGDHYRTVDVVTTSSPSTKPSTARVRATRVDAGMSADHALRSPSGLTDVRPAPRCNCEPRTCPAGSPHWGCGQAALSLARLGWFGRLSIERLPSSWQSCPVGFGRGAGGTSAG